MADESASSRLGILLQQLFNTGPDYDKEASRIGLDPTSPEIANNLAAKITSLQNTPLEDLEGGNPTAGAIQKQMGQIQLMQAMQKYYMKKQASVAPASVKK